MRGHLPGTAWRFKIVASGELSGLGEVEAYMTHCTVYDPESGAPPTYYEEMTTFRTTEADLLSVDMEAARAWVAA